jgi:cell wall-associated NlpC family hydrolase
MFLPKKHADLPIEPSVLESLRAQEKSLKREKRKAAKERRQHAKQVKKAEKHAKKRITARKVPQKASDCLQYLSMSQDGICEVEPGLFSMTMAFTDVNFQIAMLEEQKNIFTKYSEFLNYFDPSLHLEINLVTRSMDEEQFRRDTFLPLRGNNRDRYAEEMNQVVAEKALRGQNGLIREKYVTFSLHAENYDTLTGQRSNNMQHGVTWSYANGIYNDTAEIISMAAVYYQQDWPSSQELAAFTDDVPFTQYCRALTAYGMEITARESAPYSCISYGGCVNGYRSEGETVTITEYRCETHTCAQGNEECGHYHNGIWEWSDGHEEGGSYPEWIEDGTHDVTVFFPVIFPDGATQSELCALPDNYTQVVDGKIAAEDCTGSIVLDESANLYKGELNEWFYPPNERTATFTVETTDGDEVMTKDYTVTFANATAIPWCPGELHDGQYGHYDLNCTIYLTGYDRYADPETEAPNGADGGTGNLDALAASSNDGTLTRTVIKQDQYGNAYAGNAVTARFTKTVTLPPGAAGFKGWYENGADAYGNVEWASFLYRMDWEALYGVADGIKCRSVGSALTAEELQALLAGLNIDPDTARGQVVAFAISCQGHFVYGQPSSLRGGPGNASVGMNLDCSSFVQYCYWAQGLPFAAGNTASYGRTNDLRAISLAEVQPGDLRVVYAAGGEQGHVQMALGGGAWIECCYGYGVCVNMSNAWMESRGCHYFTYAGF